MRLTFIQTVSQLYHDNLHPSSILVDLVNCACDSYLGESDTEVIQAILTLVVIRHNQDKRYQNVNEVVLMICK